MLPLLSAGTPSFHVVALSLPGFWFSSLKRLRRKGSESISMPRYVIAIILFLTLLRFAQVSHKVMMALSYSEYGESSARAFVCYVLRLTKNQLLTAVIWVR